MPTRHVPGTRASGPTRLARRFSLDSTAVGLEESGSTNAAPVAPLPSRLPAAAAPTSAVCHARRDLPPHPSISQAGCGIMRHLLLPRRLLAMAPLSASAATKALLLNPARGRLPSSLACLSAPGARSFRAASLRCYAAAAVAEQHRIKVNNPIVEMDGALPRRHTSSFLPHLQRY